jgi:hypothetical protein
LFEGEHAAIVRAVKRLKQVCAAVSEIGKHSRLPADWQPSEGLIAYAANQGMAAARIALEAEKFKNYWMAKSGAGAMKRDWPTTWRNWITAHRSPSSACPADCQQHEPWRGHLRTLPGRGTTLIAAETVRRTCFAVELSPAYVDVAARRWQAFTRKAKRSGDGREFDALSSDPEDA